LREILEDHRRPSLERLRVLVHEFLRSECEEALVRVALSDAAPLYRDAPESREAKSAGAQAVQAFMHEVLPGVSEAKRALAGDLIATTLSAVGKKFSASPRTAADIEAEAVADMLCGYVVALRVGTPREEGEDRMSAVTAQPACATGGVGHAACTARHAAARSRDWRDLAARPRAGRRGIGWWLSRATAPG
jgi:tetracycline repressor-like protein